MKMAAHTMHVFWRAWFRVDESPDEMYCRIFTEEPLSEYVSGSIKVERCIGVVAVAEGCEAS